MEATDNNSDLKTSSNADANKFKGKPRTKGQKIIVLVCAMLNYAIIIGAVYSMTNFMPYWLQQFKRSRAETAIIQSTLGGFAEGMGTVGGLVLDKFGIRVTALTGSLLCGIGFIAAAFATSTEVLVITLGVIGGTGGSFINLSCVVAISSSFDQSAGALVCLLNSMGAAGVAFYPYINKYLIETFGWRGALMIHAGLYIQTFSIGYLMTVFVKFQTLPSAQKKRSQICSGGSVILIKLTNICQMQYICVCATTFATFMAANGFIFILSDYFADTESYLLALSITLIVGINVFGLISSSKHINSSILLALSALLLGIILYLFTIVSGFVQTMISFVIFSLGICGIVSMNNVTVMDLVSRENYPIAIGMINTLKGIANILGGFFYGLLYDITQSYTTPLVTMATVSCIFSFLPVLGLMSSKMCKSTKSYELNK